MTAQHDLLYSEIEDELRASVRSLLNDRSPVATVLERVEGAEPADANLWKTLAAELGTAGLAIPEERGGAGASFREAGVVLEELGRAVTPVPYLGSAVTATAAVLACDDAELLGGLASGDRTAALAVPASTAPTAPLATMISANGGMLSGTITSVADALAADVLLVPTADRLYAVETSAAGVTRAPVTSLDLTRRLCDVTLDHAAGRVLATGTAAGDAVAAGLTAGAALLASEQLGTAEWCLTTTVDYLKTRHQFGRPVGSFQALKHRMADLWVGVTQARAVARYAAACVAGGDPDTAVAVAVAQAHCSEVAVLAAEECIQLHGGIGFAWEHPSHLFLKRAKSQAIMYGTPDRHRAALATLADLPAAG